MAPLLFLSSLSAEVKNPASFLSLFSIRFPAHFPTLLSHQKSGQVKQSLEGIMHKLFNFEIFSEQHIPLELGEGFQ